MITEIYLYATCMLDIEIRSNSQNQPLKSYMQTPIKSKIKSEIPKN